MALSNPGNIDAAISLTHEQFHYGFGKRSRPRSRPSYTSAGRSLAAQPLFQTASANLNPTPRPRSDPDNEDRGPLHCSP